MPLSHKIFAKGVADSHGAIASAVSRSAILPESMQNARPRRAWTVPPRLQLFEFCDQGWLKGTWREAYLDGLNFLFRCSRVYCRMHEPFCRWACRSRSARVLDLASGGAGPVGTMLDAAAREGKPIPRVTLSDLHPDLDAFRRVQAAFPHQVDFVTEALDASGERCASFDAPMRSICAGFHHFDHDGARRVLRMSVAHADGLFIMEPMERTWFSLVSPLPCFLLILLAPFFARRFSAKKFVITTLLPLVPLMVVFDGVASVLRTYRREELWEMLPAAARHVWHWEWGTCRYAGLFRATYLCGWRKQEEHDRANDRFRCFAD